LQCIRNDGQNHRSSKARTQQDCDGVLSHGDAARPPCLF
jgi:hypothetical protein